MVQIDARQQFAHGLRSFLENGMSCKVIRPLAARPHSHVMGIEYRISCSPKMVPAAIVIRDYSPTQPVADIEELAGSLNAMNTAKMPNLIQPVHKQWQPHLQDGRAVYDFPPHSFTVTKFN